MLQKIYRKGNQKTHKKTAKKTAKMEPERVPGGLPGSSHNTLLGFLGFHFSAFHCSGRWGHAKRIQFTKHTIQIAVVLILIVVVVQVVV